MSAVGPLQEMSLRPLVPQDVGDIMAIERRAYDFPWTAGVFLDCLRVGYCLWGLWEGANLRGYSVTAVAVGDAHLLNLCVDPVQHGRGFGRRLLLQTLDVARGHDASRVVLEVRPSNWVARSLYCRHGFRQIGIRRGYYPARRGREDALVLARNL
jgi:ribosomal-protein-alanine N-acetyltransferase